MCLSKNFTPLKITQVCVGIIAASAMVTNAQSSVSSASDHRDAFVIDLITTDSSSSDDHSTDLNPDIVPSFAESAFAAPTGTFGAQLVANGTNGISGLSGVGPALGADLSAPMNSANLKPIDSVGIPSEIYVVPLPSAAFAGLGMLMGIAGVRFARTRK